MSKQKYLANERYCREQARKSDVDRGKWLQLADEWAVLAAGGARIQQQQQQQPQARSLPEDET